MKFSIQKLLLLTALVGLQSAVHAAEIFAADADAGLTPSVRKGRYKYVALSDNDDDGAPAPTRAELVAPSRKKVSELRAPSNHVSRRVLSIEAKRQAQLRAAKHVTIHSPKVKPIHSPGEIALLDLYGVELEPMSSHAEEKDLVKRKALKDKDKALKETDRAIALRHLESRKLITLDPDMGGFRFRQKGVNTVHDLINTAPATHRRHHRRRSEDHNQSVQPGLLFSPVKSKSRQLKEQQAADTPFQAEMREGNRRMAALAEMRGLMQYITMQADPKGKLINEVYIKDLEEGLEKSKSINKSFEPGTHRSLIKLTPLGLIKLNQTLNLGDPALINSPTHRAQRHSPKPPKRALQNSPTALTLERAQEEKE